jgi:hypothetical protein
MNFDEIRTKKLQRLVKKIPVILHFQDGKTSFCSYLNRIIKRNSQTIYERAGETGIRSKPVNQHNVIIDLSCSSLWYTQYMHSGVIRHNT